jgi:hypothetical protein
MEVDTDDELIESLNHLHRTGPPPDVTHNLPILKQQQNHSPLAADHKDAKVVASGAKTIHSNHLTSPSPAAAASSHYYQAQKKSSTATARRTSENQPLLLNADSSGHLSGGDDDDDDDEDQMDASDFVHLSCNHFEYDPEFNDMVKKVEFAIDHNILPQRIYEGSSGSYFCKSSDNVKKPV